MQITASPRPDTRPTFEVVLHARLQNLVSAPGEVVAPTTSTVRAVKTAVRGRRARCPGSSMKPSQDRASPVGNRVCHHVGFKCFAMSGRLVTLMSRIESHRTFQRDETDSISLAQKETCGLGRRGLFSCLEDPQENAFCYGSLLAPARSSSWDRGTAATAGDSGDGKPEWDYAPSARPAAGSETLAKANSHRPVSGKNQKAGPPSTKDSAGVWQVNRTNVTLSNTVTDADGDTAI